VRLFVDGKLLLNLWRDFVQHGALAFGGGHTAGNGTNQTASRATDQFRNASQVGTWYQSTKGSASFSAFDCAGTSTNGRHNA
jgi:hypothetical protein